MAVAPPSLEEKHRNPSFTIEPLTAEYSHAAVDVWADAMRTHRKDYIEAFIAQKCLEDMKDPYASYTTAPGLDQFWVALRGGQVVGTVAAIYRSAEDMSLPVPAGKAYLKNIKDADGNSISKGVGEGVEPLWGPVGPRGEIAAMELVRMAVAPSARGMGLARLLTQTVARHAEAHGCGWVVLSTGAEMDSAVRTYNGLGFNGYARSKSMVFAATPKQLLPACEA